LKCMGPIKLMANDGAYVAAYVAYAQGWTDPPGDRKKSRWAGPGIGPFFQRCGEDEDSD